MCWWRRNEILPVNQEHRAHVKRHGINFVPVFHGFGGCRKEAVHRRIAFLQIIVERLELAPGAELSNVVVEHQHHVHAFALAQKLSRHFLQIAVASDFLNGNLNPGFLLEFRRDLAQRIVINPGTAATVMASCLFSPWPFAPPADCCSGAGAQPAALKTSASKLAMVRLRMNKFPLFH